MTGVHDSPRGACGYSYNRQTILRKQRDMLSILAFSSMILGHYSTLTATLSPLLSLAECTALPLWGIIFGAHFAVGSVHEKSLAHLWRMSLLCQPLYWLAFKHTGIPWYQPDPLFAFAVTGSLVRGVERAGWYITTKSVSGMLIYIALSGNARGGYLLLVLSTSVLIFRAPVEYRWAIWLFWAVAITALTLPRGIAVALGCPGALISMWLLVTPLAQGVPRRFFHFRWFAEGYLLLLMLMALSVTI
ncbi:TPA: hypothetical protein OMU28_002119 [Klebsiella aerogenes]|nr:hypothetical protein [Klebsiella aerogenes]